MQHLLQLCSILVAIAASAIPFPTGLTCSEKDHDQACHIEGFTFDSAASSNSLSFPDVPLLYLDNCTIDDFSQHFASHIPSTTESLFILDGYVPKVYLKPSLKSFTALRAATAEIAIDPDDNHNLEILDIEGLLQSIPFVWHLKKLATLDLCVNEIKSWNLNHLDGLGQLRKLNLGHNQIDTVISSSEVNLPALKELFLHDNRITTLDLTHLKADRLERLYLSQNHLIQIEGFPQRFNHLRRVDLYQNKWNCEWLERTLSVLKNAGVETLSYLPGKVCDESGSVKVEGVMCDKDSTAF